MKVARLQPLPRFPPALADTTDEEEVAALEAFAYAIADFFANLPAVDESAGGIEVG